MTLYKEIKNLRKLLGLSQAELARMVGVSIQTICSAEKNKHPNAPVLLKAYTTLYDQWTQSEKYFNLDWNEDSPRYKEWLQKRDLKQWYEFDTFPEFVEKIWALDDVSFAEYCMPTGLKGLAIDYMALKEGKNGRAISTGAMNLFEYGFDKMKKERKSETNTRQARRG